MKNITFNKYAGVEPVLLLRIVSTKNTFFKDSVWLLLFNFNVSISIETVGTKLHQVHVICNIIFTMTKCKCNAKENISSFWLVI